MTTRKGLPVLPEGGADPIGDAPLTPSRRAFLRTAAAGAAIATASGCGVDLGDFFRKHFKELSKDELAKVLARVERRNRERFGKDTKVTAEGPRPGVEFGYGLDISRCIGCRRCVYACVKENNQSREQPQIHWIRVLEMDKDRGVDLAHAELYYEADAVPRPGKFYFPVQCQQCRHPPCVKACPTQATWKEPDGIVVIDYDWCIGCRRCVYACVKENNQSREHPQIQWIRVLEMDKDQGVDLAHAELYYETDAVPRPGKFYFPVQCQQCREPPCVKVCPTQATWKEPDGIVVVDYDWCIGCRCCMSACPYGARHFNWAEPKLTAADLNPVQHYLGNRPRPKGVVEKCTFCIQRTRNGRYPACVEICPVGARKFGNLLDPQSEIRRVMETKRVFVFKEELATHPQFYFFYAT